jgi:tubulin--tyrosine ligase
MHIYIQSPTTCANVGLHNFNTLAPSSSTPQPFDLVISGPNFGRNTGTTFSLSSGTVGAALAASLSGVKGISLSYGHFQVPTEKMKEAEEVYKQSKKAASLSTSNEDDAGPVSMTPPALVNPEVITMAHRLSCRVMEKLYKNWEDGVSVYSVNVPLSYILKDEIIHWTTVWPNRYAQLFKANKTEESGSQSYLPSSAPAPAQQLRFKPDMSGMLQPKILTEGTDIWAITNGFVSVSRLEARFAEVAPPSQGRFKL